VHANVPGFIADDQYFHMSPNSSRSLLLRPQANSRTSSLEGTVHSLNAASPAVIAVRS
jgi:hypothetical protein